MTYDRLRRRFSPEDIMVITSKEHAHITSEELPELPRENILGEPSRMNTGPACSLGAIVCDADDIILTVPADHIITNEEVFWESVEIGLEGVKRFGGLFTFGIQPTRPETGYGYIETGRQLMKGIRETVRFREKPDLETAREFLQVGNFLWNSGMFLWRAEDLIEEMRVHCPGAILPLLDKDLNDESVLFHAYEKVQRISVDNAVMEKSAKVRVVPTDPGWSDVGSWRTVRELLGYSKENDHLSLIGSNSIMVKTEKPRKVAVIGLEGVIVVDTEEGLLVLNEDRSQDVKKALKRLK
jgi:mannose-1-phosphate guanylyltransferase